MRAVGVQAFVAIDFETHQPPKPFVADAGNNSYEYRLYVQKQPGTRAVPLTVTVAAPPGMKIVSVELDGEELGSGLSEIVTDLREDRQIVVKYAPRG